MERVDRSYLELFRRKRGNTTLLINFAGSYEGNIDPESYDQYAKDCGGGLITSLLCDLLQEKLSVLTNDGLTAQVLDVAAGTGRNAKRLASQGYKVTAMDLSPSMLNVLENEPDIEQVISDMNGKFPFSDESFNGVITLWANRFIKDIKYTGSQIHRVLKPNGVFILPVISEDEEWKFLSHSNQPTNTAGIRKLLLNIGFAKVDVFHPILSTEIAGLYDIPTFLIAKK
jgi:SAM-dependent methyltransferase